MILWYLSRIPELRILKPALLFMVFQWLVFNPGIFSGSVFAMEERFFGGSLDFIGKNLDFKIDLKERGAIDLKGNVDENEKYALNLSLRHFKLGKADIQTEFVTKGVVKRSADRRIVSLIGNALTQATLLNHKPLKEFRFSYELDRNRLKITSFSWAELNMKGQIILRPSVVFDLALVVKDMDIRDLAELFGFDVKGLGLGGVASGKFTIKGPPRDVQINGRLLAYDGRLSEIKFNSARINLSGSWPILHFADSYINSDDGVVYSLKGQFNLKELSDSSSLDNRVMVYSANNAIRLQDWVIKRQPDIRGEDMVEAEYSLKKNQALKMRIKNEGESLAWEKSIKF